MADGRGGLSLAEAVRAFATARGTRPVGAPADIVVAETPVDAADSAWARGPRAQVGRLAIQSGALFPLARALARPSVAGVELLRHVPQPALIVANHASHLDTSLVLGALPLSWRRRTAVAAAADTFFTDPVRARALALTFAAIPFHREGRDQIASVTAACDLLDTGWNLLFFAQGGRRAEGDLGRLGSGAGRIAVRTGVPVVPVLVEGTGSVLPKGARLPRPGRTRIVFGEALWPVTSPRPERPAALARRIEAALAALAGGPGTPSPVAAFAAAAATEAARPRRRRRRRAPLFP